MDRARSRERAATVTDKNRPRITRITQIPTIRGIREIRGKNFRKVTPLGFLRDLLWNWVFLRPT
jgi:hypothetical protein